MYNFRFVKKGQVHSGKEIREELGYFVAQINSSLTRDRVHSGERLFIAKGALCIHNAALKKVQRQELNRENKQH